MASQIAITAPSKLETKASPQALRVMLLQRPASISKTTSAPGLGVRAALPPIEIALLSAPPAAYVNRPKPAVAAENKPAVVIDRIGENEPNSAAPPATGDVNKNHVSPVEPDVGHATRDNTGTADPISPTKCASASVLRSMQSMQKKLSNWRDATTKTVTPKSLKSRCGNHAPVEAWSEQTMIVHGGGTVELMSGSFKEKDVKQQTLGKPLIVDSPCNDVRHRKFGAERRREAQKCMANCRSPNLRALLRRRTSTPVVSMPKSKVDHRQQIRAMQQEIRGSCKSLQETQIGREEHSDVCEEVRKLFQTSINGASFIN